MSFDMNSGYVGYSMSKRAETALEDGKAPLSHWTKSYLLDKLEEYENIDTKNLEKYSLKTLQSYFLSIKEFHHMGKYCNKIDFYGINEEVIFNIDYDRLNKIEEINKQKRQKKEIPKIKKAKITYEENVSKYRNYPQYKRICEWCLIVGDWAYLSSGSKKKITGKHVVSIKELNFIPIGTIDIFENIKEHLPISNKEEFSTKEQLFDNKEVVLEAVKQCEEDLQYASKELRNDKEVVLAAVEKHGYALQYASKELKNDKEVVLVAVNNYGPALEYASDKLKNDKDVVLTAIKEIGFALEYASKKLKNDKEVVLTAVKENGQALRFASNKLKSDKKVVLTAVKKDGYALEHASKELQNDKEVVLAAVKGDGYALRFASDELKNDKDFLQSISNDEDEVVEDDPFEESDPFATEKKQEEGMTI